MNARGVKILIVDGDTEILDALGTGFELAWPDSEVISASDGTTGLDLFYKHRPSIVLLELCLRGTNGFDVLTAMRQAADVPLVILTEQDTSNDKVRAFELGADDFMPKPFRSQELIARMRDLLRRAQAIEGYQGQTPCAVGGLVIHLGQRLVEVRGVAVTLTPTEHCLLAHLARNLGRCVIHRELAFAAWGPEYANAIDGLRAYVWRLRQKVERDPYHPEYLLAVRGIGYRMVDPGPT